MVKNKYFTFCSASILFLCVCIRVFATQPTAPEWNKPLLAYNVFVAGFFPDNNGHFEIEIYCEANYDIDWLSLSVAHTENIVFTEKLPSYEGKMKEGGRKVWRLKGTVHGNIRVDEFEMPGSVILNIEYRFPYDEVLKDVTKRYPMDTPMRQDLLHRLQEVKGKTMRIIKPLPVESPNLNESDIKDNE